MKSAASASKSVREVKKMEKGPKNVSGFLLTLLITFLLILSAIPSNMVAAYEPQVGDQAEFEVNETHDFNLDITLYTYNMSTDELVHVVHEIRQGLDVLTGKDQFKILELFYDDFSHQNLTKLDHVGIFNGTHEETVTRDHYDPFSGQWDNSTADDEHWIDTFDGQFRNQNEHAAYNETYFPLDGPGPRLGQMHVNLNDLPMRELFDNPPDVWINFTWSLTTYNTSYYTINDVPQTNMTVREVFAYGDVLIPEVRFAFMKPPPENETAPPPSLHASQEGEPMPPPPNLDFFGYNVTIGADFMFVYDTATGFLLEYYEYFFVYTDMLVINGTAYAPPPPPPSDGSLGVSQTDEPQEVRIEGNGTFDFYREFGLTLTKHSRLYGGYDFSNDNLFDLVPPEESSGNETSTSPTGETNETTNSTTSPGNNTSLPSIVTPGFELAPLVATISLIGVVTYVTRRKNR